MPTETTNSVHNSNRAAFYVIAGALVLLAASLGGWYFYLKSKAANLRALDIAASVRTGDYEQASSQYQKIIDDPASGPNRLAQAAFSVYPAKIKSPNEALRHEIIAELKRIVLDEGVQPRLRAQAILLLANAYYESGDNPVVYNEVYTGKPFEDMLRKGSINRTTRDMLKWSYSIDKTSRAAIGISVSYIKDVIRNTYFTDEKAKVETPVALKSAKEYLAIARDLSAKEEKNIPEYTKSNRYAGFRYWSAFVSGMLAYFGDEEFRSLYQKDYEDFMRDFEASGDAESSMYLEFAYYNYAALLVMMEKDVEAARPLIGKLMARLNSAPNLNYNEFVLVTRVKEDRTQRDFDTEAKAALSAEFSEFKDFIENPR